MYIILLSLGILLKEGIKYIHSKSWSFSSENLERGRRRKRIMKETYTPEMVAGSRTEANSMAPGEEHVKPFSYLGY
jgi:hypothetical protein